MLRFLFGRTADVRCLFNELLNYDITEDTRKLAAAYELIGVFLGPHDFSLSCNAHERIRYGNIHCNNSPALQACFAREAGCRTA